MEEVQKQYLDYEGLELVLKQIDDLYISNSETNHKVEWDNILNKPEIVTLGDLINYVKADDLLNYYTKEELDQKITGIYKFSGTVETYEDLLTIENPKVGETYNVKDTGMNYAWDGQAWDNLGSFVDLSDYLTKDEIRAITEEEIDTIFIKLENDSLNQAFSVSLTKGGQVTIAKSFTLDGGLSTADRNNIAVDTQIELGESVISTPATMTSSTGSANYSVFYVNEAVTVELSATTGGIHGEIEPTENDGCFCGTVNHVDGVLNVRSGNYYTGQVCFYCLKGTINIYGGTFAAEPYKVNGKPYTLNCQNANYNAGLAKINVYGGEFRDFDPSNPTSDDARNYVAEGYKVISEIRDDGYTWYTVVPE